MSIRPGAVILNNKYRIQRLIGEGGMARVWLADDMFADRPVAIKEPHAGLGSTDVQQIRGRFQKEVKVSVALEQARTPNIVRAYGVEQYEGELLLVLEYLPGGDLERRIQEDPEGMPIEDVLTIAGDVLTALNAVHKHPWDIVHRDIKPSNILFDKDGQARLADFGLAQVAGWSSGRSAEEGGSHPGTPAYMAPEQATEKGYLTPAADIYSLGAVLFEMLTGKKYKRYQPGTRASSLRSDIPDWLDELVARALREDPWQRWKNGGAMLAALQSRKSDATPFKNDEGTGETRFVRPWLLIAAPILLLLLLGGGWWMARGKGSQDTAASAAVITITSSSSQPVNPETAPTLGLEAAVSARATTTPIETTPTSLPSATSAPPTATPVPPTATPVPPTSTPIPPTATPIPPTDTPIPDAIVKANSLRMRVGPDTAYNVIATYPSGTELAVLGKNTNGNWLNVHAPDDKTGWMATSLLTVNRNVDTLAIVEAPSLPTPSHKGGDITTSPRDGMVMVYVPAGEFLMGSNSGEADEQPQHTIYLNAFWIDKTEVTVTQYRQCVESGACSPPKNGECTYYQAGQIDHPVNCLRWEDAKTYCAWGGRRLPTEAEWEKAARGTNGWEFSWGNTFNGTLLNYCDSSCPAQWRDMAYNDGFAYTAPVGSFPPGSSPYGTLDMLGNEWEWVSDWYSESYYQTTPYKNPLGPSFGEKKVARGGSWNTGANNVRASNRYSDYPDSRGAYYGFRCALSAQ